VGRVKLRRGCRVQIDHPMPLVAEDLREIVVLAGASEVILGGTKRASARQRPDLWITEAGGAGAEVSTLFEKAGWVAERTIVLFSGMSAPADLPPNVYLLSEPFRTEDVLRVLRDAGLTERRTD